MLGPVQTFIVCLNTVIPRGKDASIKTSANTAVDIVIYPAIGMLM